MVTVHHGTASTSVVKVNVKTDARLFLRCALGMLNQAQVVSLPTNIRKIPKNSAGMDFYLLDLSNVPEVEQAALAGARWFSTMDLTSGYNQVPVAERDKAKTAFCTPLSLFKFNRVPFGLCNAPGTFQRLMQQIFGAQHFQTLLLYLT